MQTDRFHKIIAYIPSHSEIENKLTEMAQFVAELNEEVEVI